MGGVNLSITFDLTAVKFRIILTGPPGLARPKQEEKIFNIPYQLPLKQCRIPRRDRDYRRGKERINMNSLLFLIAAAGIVMLAAMRENRKLRKSLKVGQTRAGWLPKAVTLLIISSQLSELLKVLNEASVMHLVATLFLLAMVTAVQSGTESEWH